MSDKYSDLLNRIKNADEPRYNQLDKLGNLPAGYVTLVKTGSSGRKIKRDPPKVNVDTRDIDDGVSDTESKSAEDVTSKGFYADSQKFKDVPQAIRILGQMLNEAKNSQNTIYEMRLLGMRSLLNLLDR